MSITIRQRHNVNCIPTDKLLPCPFCGSEPKVAEKEPFFKIYCGNGGCTAVGDCELCYCWIEEYGKKSAIQRWNSRLVLFVGATEFIEEKLSNKDEYTVTTKQADAVFGYARGYHIIYEDNVIEAIKHVKRWGRDCGCEHPNCTGFYEHTIEAKLIEDDLQGYIEDHFSFNEALTMHNKR